MILNNLIFTISILFVFISLLTFNDLDPSITNTGWNENNIDNFFGLYGSCCADILFFIFGRLAYLIPLNILIIYLSILLQKLIFNRIILFFISNQLIGCIILIITACSLVSMNEETNSIYFGGILGKLVIKIIFNIFSLFYSTLLLLISLIISFILLTMNIWYLNFFYIKNLLKIKNRINNLNIIFILKNTNKNFISILKNFKIYIIKNIKKIYLKYNNKNILLILLIIRNIISLEILKKKQLFYFLFKNLIFRHDILKDRTNNKYLHKIKKINQTSFNKKYKYLDSFFNLKKHSKKQ